ncbi:hypothetical protein G6F56_013049 [Rhizopus delemar]|nr:hypothetical protein G6F56_013049 [Rhizopus delemar]
MLDMKIKEALETMSPPPEYESGDEGYYTPPSTPYGYTITFHFLNNGKNIPINIPTKAPFITVAELKMIARSRLPPSISDTVELTCCGVALKDHVQFAPRSDLIEARACLYQIRKGDVIKVICSKRKDVC